MIKGLFQPETDRTVWLGLSFVAPLYFGLVTLGYQLFGPEYLIQDDMRQHVVWLQRFVDPQLFPGDAIADYYLAIEPTAYKGLYWCLAQIGLEPLLVAKLLPLLLALITTLFAFKIALRLLPVPICGFLATLILNQQIWLDDELITATPRAFYYPLLTIFLYCLLKQALLPSLVVIVLQGLFYAPSMLLSVAILSVRLWPWGSYWPRWQALAIHLRHPAHRHRYVFWLAGCGAAGLVILWLLHHQSAVGPTITTAQMRVLPEFDRYGRHEYFGVHPLYFLFQGRSGLNVSWFPASILMGLALPFLSAPRFRLTQKLKPALLYQGVIASLGLYITAHFLLFKLYFPSRYTYHSLRVLLALAAGITLTILGEAGWRWLRSRWHSQQRWLLIIIGLVLTLELLVPALPPLFLALQVWIEGQSPALYTYLAQQPRDTVVATLAEEGDNLGAFSQRSTLVGREFALTFHPQYYQVMQQRVVDLLQAQYSPDPTVVQQIIDRYGIDYFLIERAAFSPDYLLGKNWLVHSSAQATVAEVVNNLQNGVQPAVLEKLDTCDVLSADSWVLLETQCVKTLR